MSQVYTLDEGIEGIRNKAVLPQREYAAPDKRPYANFSKMYVSFYTHKVMALYKVVDTNGREESVWDLSLIPNMQGLQQYPVLSNPLGI